MATELLGAIAVTDGLSLAMVSAMVSMSHAPLLLLDGDLNVIAASRSFYSAFHIEPAETTDRTIFELGDGRWNMPRLRSLLTATASGHGAVDAYELDMPAKGGQVLRLVVKAQKLNYGAVGATRLLVTVSDVTETRHAEQVKDDLLRQNAALLQELQHRVANSLQIIASVLLQSARHVQSAETKTHLSDAHNRVMSIATVQQQLATAGKDDVELRAYFNQLCQSLGASMIRDHDKQTINVTADDSTVSAEASVSLGLIVTELVINSIKHAFPDGRSGKIAVDYHSEGPNWTMSVADNGVGMPKDAANHPGGLGTSIVDALSRQLNARVKVAEAKPGTKVSIVHTQIAAVESDTEQRAV